MPIRVGLAVALFFLVVGFPLMGIMELHFLVNYEQAYELWLPLIWPDAENNLSLSFYSLYLLICTVALFLLFGPKANKEAIGKTDVTRRGLWLVGTVLVASILVDTLIPLSVSLFNELPETYPEYPDMVIDLGPNTLIGMIIAAVIVAPLVEEYIYRGLGMGCLLARGWSPLTASCLTGGLFALIHIQYYPSAMFAIFLSGVFLGLLRAKTGGLLLPILAHMVMNIIAVSMGYVFPDL